MNSTDMFRVETVESSVAPTGLPQGTWCSYVIASRRSRIVGRYQGTLAQTRRNAEQLASSFNERARNGTSAWAPRSQMKRKPGRPAAAASRT